MKQKAFNFVFKNFVKISLFLFSAFVFVYLNHLLPKKTVD